MKPQDLYILNQPENYRDILLHIIAVVEQVVPEATLEYKWKIPFFYIGKKPFCYLNASHKKQFVDVAFMDGFQLKLHQNLLITDGGRSRVKSLRYKTLEEIDNDVLIDLLKEAKQWLEKDNLPKIYIKFPTLFKIPSTKTFSFAILVLKNKII